MNQQRTVIYKQRSDVLENADLKAKIKSMLTETLEDAVSSYLHEDNIEQWDIEGLRQKYLGLLCLPEDFNDLGSDAAEEREKIRKTLLERADKLYAVKEELFGEQMREIERIVLLQNVDKKWMDHLEAMDSLREMIGLQAYAQRNPISEYRLQGADLFDEMITNIRDDTARQIMSVMPKPQVEMKRVEVAKPVSEGFAGAAGKSAGPKKPVVNKGQKVGRNDPCPCGSGKKYKKCCGANQADSEEE